MGVGRNGRSAGDAGSILSGMSMREFSDTLLYPTVPVHGVSEWGDSPGQRLPPRRRKILATNWPRLRVQLTLA